MQTNGNAVVKLAEVEDDVVVVAFEEGVAGVVVVVVVASEEGVAGGVAGVVVVVVASEEGVAGVVVVDVASEEGVVITPDEVFVADSVAIVVVTFDEDFISIDEVVVTVVDGSLEEAVVELTVFIDEVDSIEVDVADSNMLGHSERSKQVPTTSEYAQYVMSWHSSLTKMELHGGSRPRSTHDMVDDENSQCERELQSSSEVDIKSQEISLSFEGIHCPDISWY
eukprot:gene5398-biopygen7068